MNINSLLIFKYLVYPILYLHFTDTKHVFTIITFVLAVPSSPFEGQQIPCKDFFAYPATSEIKTYSAAVLRLPTAFYYNALTGIILTGNFVKQRSFPDSMSLPHDVTLLRRSSHDYFRPPYGPPVSYLKSVGYGKEVGLPDGVQEVYDPYTQKNLILDHNTLKIIRDNRVPLPQKDFATPTCISVGSITDENMPAHLCFQAAIVKEAFDSAQSKARVCTLSFHGQNGHPGVDGTVGMDGVHGMDGTDFFGVHGMNGEDGNYGNNGGQGTNGQNGGSALLILSGSADELVVQGRDVFRFPLGGTKSEQVLLVDCHGGHGGRGGYGGRGGDGGNGGHGAPGKNVNFYGQEGGEGGDGGDGGDGGLGGHGGDAGDGGNSGNGGKCLIKTVDPRLLMLVEVDCMPGEPGAGVKGGGGGIGGYCGIGGRKGEGGIGAGLGTFTYYHRRHGRIGRNGNRGRSGGCGLDSKSGQRGQTGGILWVVCGPNGGPIKESSTRFSAMVEGLSVVPEFDGDIYEPNERIAVYNVIVRNTGGLDLPHGVSVFMPSSQTINFEATKFDVPNDVQAGEKYIIPFKFYGRLSDLAPPNKPGPQTFEAEFRPRIELLGRPFIKKSRFKFLVQYPIQLGDLLSPEMMGQGEEAVFSIEVKNNSNLQYGTCEYSGGRVVLHLHFDSRLIPLGKITADAHAPYEMTYDHSLTDSTFIEILELPPNQSVIVSIKVQMESHAELFDQCPWQADLHLRDKLVEYNHNTIRRVTLTYNPQKIPADVLLVMSEVMTRQELDFWYHVFHLLGVSFDIWDTALYGGFSVDNRTGLRHRDTWYGRYHGKLILYPHCNNLQLLAGVDIAHHFHGVTFREQPLQELDSSLVIFMPLSEHNEMEMVRHLAEVHPNIEVPENDYSGSHLTKPGLHDSPAPYKNCERRLVKRIEESNLSQAPLLLSRRVNIMHINLHKYSYGWVDIRQVPILKSSKFLLIDDSECYDTTSSSSDAETDAEIISLANRYGQTILAILCGISIPAKLKLIKKETSKPSDIFFYLPNASIMGIEELAMVTLAWEVADELFSLSGEAYRMKQLYSDIVDNTLAYVECGRVVLRGLKLIEKELKNRISAGLQHHLAKQAHGKITEMCKGIQKILSEAGVNNSKLKDMPSLDQLQDCSCIHRCHQHFIKDEQWNLADN